MCVCVYNIHLIALFTFIYTQVRLKVTKFQFIYQFL